MKVLVTGANGLLGANVARTLFRAGEDVLLFVRPKADLASIRDLSCEIIYGDIADVEAVSEAVQRADAVIHCASSTDMRPHPFTFYQSINIEGTKNIISALADSPQKRLIYISTANTFAPGSKGSPGTELNSFNLFDCNSGYINSKYIAQQLVLESVEQRKLDAVVINPTFMLGAYDAKPSSGQIVLFGLKRRITWCPPGGKNFVSVRDVAKAVLAALYRGKKGHCYLIAGENLTYKEFFHLLNATIRRRGVVIVVPKFIMLVGGIIGSVFNSLTSHKASFDLTNARLLSSDNYYSGKKSEMAFGIKPTEVKLAIAEAIEWFVNNRNIRIS